MELRGKSILLGVTGGIAVYKAADLASKLTQAGAAVDVVMTEAATRFVTPLTFEAVTGRQVYTSFWDRRFVTPDHIALADRPDLAVIAPATANTLAKYVHGVADNLLLATLLATRAPVLVAPAMNDNMWAHAATQANLALLRERGVKTVGPETGHLACGRVGTGRMSQPDAILAAISEMLTAS